MGAPSGTARRWRPAPFRGVALGAVVVMAAAAFGLWLSGRTAREHPRPPADAATTALAAAGQPEVPAASPSPQAAPADGAATPEPSVEAGPIVAAGDGVDPATRGAAGPALRALFPLPSAEGFPAVRGLLARGEGTVGQLVDGTGFWLRQGDDQVLVVTAGPSAAPAVGEAVSVEGIVVGVGEDPAHPLELPEDQGRDRLSAAGFYFYAMHVGPPR